MMITIGGSSLGLGLGYWKRTVDPTFTSNRFLLVGVLSYMISSTIG